MGQPIWNFPDGTCPGAEKNCNLVYINWPKIFFLIHETQTFDFKRNYINTTLFSNQHFLPVIRRSVLPLYLFTKFLGFVFFLVIHGKEFHRWKVMPLLGRFALYNISSLSNEPTFILSKRKEKKKIEALWIGLGR